MLNLQNKQCFTTVVIVIAAIIAFYYIVYPNINLGSSEGFNGEEQLAEIIPEPEQQDSNNPHIDPNTGTIMDGPGFEKGNMENAGSDVEGAPENIPSQIPSNFYFLDDGADGEMSIQHNMCSKSCCSEQWPTPFKQKYDPYVCGNKDKFVGSNIFCNNSFQDSGCLCLSKKQSKFIYNRGGNGREWF